MVNEDLDYLTATALDNASFQDTLVGTDVIFRSLAEGNRYTFAHLVPSVADGGTVRVFADLPETADFAVTVGVREITATAEVTGNVYANVTHDTAGTVEDARNDRISLDATTDSEVNWETGGTYSNLGESTPLLVPGGTGGTRSGAIGSASTAYVEPGTNLLWELTSGSVDNDILFTVVYSEDSVNGGA